jgi:hypothetical protein
MFSGGWDQNVHFLKNFRYMDGIWERDKFVRD